MTTPELKLAVWQLGIAQYEIAERHGVDQSFVSHAIRYRRNSKKAKQIRAWISREINQRNKMESLLRAA